MTDVDVEEQPEEIRGLLKMIEEAGSVDAAMEIIRERMHPNGMCGCCGQANPVGSKISARGTPACSMLCAYHLLHPEETGSQKHAALSRLRIPTAGEDVDPGGSEALPELRSDEPRDP